MRKLELYNTTLSRVSDLQKQLGVQKERFLEGQGDYLMKMNDRMTKIRNEVDTRVTFKDKIKAFFSWVLDTKNEKSSGLVREMNELLRRTQKYLNIIHDVEMSESKMNSLISQAEILEEQALAQEKVTFINRLQYLQNMTIEEKMNKLIAADDKPNLANLTPDRQSLFMNCLSYTKDLLKNANNGLLDNVAKDLYECVKDVDNIDEVLSEEPLKQIAPLVLNSLAIVLLEELGIDTETESEEPYYYDEIFESTGWIREYALNDYVDINGIIDSATPIHQVIITEIANRIDMVNVSYDVVKSYMNKMSETEVRDAYLLNEIKYQDKYSNTIDVIKLKKLYAYAMKQERVKAKDISKAFETTKVTEEAFNDENEIESRMA